MPLKTLQPPPLSDIVANASDPTISDSVFSGSPTDLGVEVFDFSTSTLNNLKHGILYNMTFAINDVALSQLLPPQSLFVTLLNCQNGYYAVNRTSTCSIVPVGGETLPTNETLWLFAQPGYWRPDWQITQFYECPGSNCVGGFYSDCVTGTNGVVCAVCQPGWGKQGTSCLECPAEAINALVIIGIVIAIIIVITIMVNANLTTEVKPKSAFSIVIKILLNHLQTASLMQDFQAKIEGIVKSLFDIQAQATPSTNFSSFACLTGWNAYTVFIMWMVVPIFVLGVPGIVSVVAAIFQRQSLAKKKARLNEELKRRHSYGLNDEDLLMHIESLEKKQLPERIFLTIEEEADLENLDEPGSEMEDVSMEDIRIRENTQHFQAQADAAERKAEIDRRAEALFGAEPQRRSQGTSQGSRTPRRASLQPGQHGTGNFHGGGDGLESCSVCKADYAMYICEECVENQQTLFCDSCWAVQHAPTGDRAAHDRYMFRVTNRDLRPYNPKYAKLYKEVMSTKGRVPALEIYIVTVLVVIFLAYPSLMTQIAILLKCTEISSIGRSFLAADYSIECTTPEYRRWVTVAQIFFLIYGLGIPFCGSLLLFLKRKTLMEKKTLSTYGFLYSGYRLKTFFWEFVIMIRKTCVVFIVVFYAGTSDYSIMFGMWLVLTFLIINIMVQPFQLRLYWKLENISLASITITLNAAMLYQPRFALDSTQETLVTLFIFIVNVMVLVMFLYYIVDAFRIQMLQVFDLDGSGDVSWDELVLVIKHKLFTDYGETMRSWGFQLEDVSAQIEEHRNRRKTKKMEAAQNGWVRATKKAEEPDDLEYEEEEDEEEEEVENEQQPAEAPPLTTETTQAPAPRA